MYIVYKHINKFNNHVYVGITHYENPNKRWRNGHGYKHSIKFYNAIIKYGWDNFIHEVVYVDTKEEAIQQEKEQIAYYKSLGISYNIAEGGEGAEAMAPETIEKLKQYTPWIKGKKHTKEAIEKIRKAGHRPMPENVKQILRKVNSERPHIVTEEQRLKKRLINTKPVLQFNKDGSFVAEYISAQEAERSLGVQGHHISCVCNGKRKSAYGYIWKYKEI